MIANTDDYYAEIQNLEEKLKSDTSNQAELAILHSRLDGLMRRFKNDLSLGTDRYGLYQMQAMISFRQGDYEKSKRFIDYAVTVKGSDFKFAEALNKRLTEVEFVPKSEKVWWWLIIAPLAGLVLVAFLQLISNFMLSATDSYTGLPTDSAAATTFDVVSVIVGTISVLVALFLPIWVIELVRIKKNNKNHGYGMGLKKRNGILIAVFLGIWYWAYTYRTDKVKFWINLTLCVVTFGYWGVVPWVWTVIDAVKRPDDFYTLYPYYTG